ncbi:MAG TPA: hypothetical protein VF691_17990 [Cytophagaceae bacterium]|jgi:tetratricopeptide (TPR) repeat protein
MEIDEFFSQNYVSGSIKDREQFVEVYERLKEKIEFEAIERDPEKYNQVMRLTADYAHILVEKDSFNKAIPYLERAIHLMEGYTGFDQNKLWKVEFYTVLRFDRMVANYKLKNFDKAQADSVWLIKYFPENDQFQNWFNTIRRQKLNKTHYLFLALTIIGIFLSMVKDGENEILHWAIIILLSIGLIGSLSIEILKRRNIPINAKKNTPNQ